MSEQNINIEITQTQPSTITTEQYKLLSGVVGGGLPFKFDIDPDNFTAPLDGTFVLNNIDPSLATKIAISYNTKDGVDVSVWEKLSKTSHLFINRYSDPSVYALFIVSNLVDQGTWVEFDIVLIGVNDWVRIPDQSVCYLSLIRDPGIDGEKGETGKSTEFRDNGTYIQWKYTTDVVWINLILKSDLIGPAGTPIEIQNSGTYIQWRYVGGSTWTNIVSLTSLKGEKGDTGKDGENIELQVAGGYIQWRVVGAISWTNLIAISDLKGDDGQDGIPIEIQNDGNYIQWEYVNEAGGNWRNIIAIADITGADGQDGAAVEIQNNGINIQWKLITDFSWNDLILVSDLKGDQGDNVVLQNSGGYIQWKLDNITDTWHNLIAVADLKGDKGDQGDQGDQGEKGDTGIGMPAGGTTDQIIAKNSNTDYDYKYISAPSSTDTNAIHKTTAAEISAMTDKATPVDADVLMIEDSATTPTAFGKKKVTFLSIYNYLKSKFDLIYFKITDFDVNVASSAVDITLTNPIANLQNITMTTTDKKVFLPVMNAANSLRKGRELNFRNTGSNTFTVYAQDTTTLLATVAAGQSARLQLVDPSTANGTFNYRLFATITGYEIGTTAGTLAEGNDARLTDSRYGKLLYTYNQDITHTGDTNEFIMKSVLIPGESMGANNRITIEITNSKTGTAGNDTTKMYFNTSADTLVGATLAATSVLAATTLCQDFRRKVVNKNNVAVNNIHSSANNVTNSEQPSLGARTQLDRNFAVDQYVIFTHKLGNANDTARIDDIQVILYEA